MIKASIPKKHLIKRSNNSSEAASWIDISRRHSTVVLLDKNKSYVE